MMHLPMIHMNGTSADTLIDQRLSVLDALHDALTHLADMAPNERDYYTSPDPDVYLKAREQHDRRRQALTDLYAEIEAEAEAIADIRDGITPRT